MRPPVIARCHAPQQISKPFVRDKQHRRRHAAAPGAATTAPRANDARLQPRSLISLSLWPDPPYAIAFDFSFIVLKTSKERKTGGQMPRVPLPSDRRPRLLLWLAIVVTTTGIGGLVNEVFELHGSLDRFRELIVRYERIDKDIAVLADSRTACAQMFVTTADEVWARCHAEYSDRLQSLIGSAFAVDQTWLDAAVADELLATSGALIDIEQRAVALVRAGTAASALELLFSDAYSTEQEMFRLAIDRLLEAVNAEENSRLTLMRKRAIRAGGAGVLILVGLLIVWGSAMVSVRKWRRALHENDVARTRLENQLSAARDEALAASRSKADFLAGMSHEIRTPMSGVIGMADLLLDSDLSKEQRYYAETIGRSGRSLLKLINDILDLSRIEAGRINLEAHPFDFEQILDETCQLLSERAHANSIDLVTRLDPEVDYRVIGDADRIRQVLTNLIGNAIKFTPANGEVFIEVTSVEANRLSRKIHVAVRDTGIGIPPEKQRQLFQPYNRGEEGALRHEPGTGLGLAISKDIVTRMGGEIGVQSKPGTGSTFWFSVTLPCDPARDAEAAFVATTGSGTTTLLFVTSSERLAAIAEDYAPGLGLRIHIAPSLGSALEWAKENREKPAAVDVVMVDAACALEAPVRTLRRLRARSDGYSLPMFWLAPVAGHGSAPPERLNIDSIIRKPLSRHRLRDALESLSAQIPPISTSSSTSTPTSTSTSTSTSSSSSSSLSVLIVEDEPVNQQVLKLQLRTLGVDASLAPNGEEAIKRFGESPFDLIFMDCHLPGIDGYETTRRIRALTQSPSHPHIVAVSADTFKEDLERCTAAGMNEHIGKPIVFEQVKRVVAALRAAPTTAPPMRGP